MRKEKKSFPERMIDKYSRDEFYSAAAKWCGLVLGIIFLGTLIGSFFNPWVWLWVPLGCVFLAMVLLGAVLVVDGVVEFIINMIEEVTGQKFD